MEQISMSVLPLINQRQAVTGHPSSGSGWVSACRDAPLERTCPNDVDAPSSVTSVEGDQYTDCMESDELPGFPLRPRVGSHISYQDSTTIPIQNTQHTELGDSWG
jgi:hypothetical protein